MKKRILSMVLCIAMMISILPQTSVFASADAQDNLQITYNFNTVEAMETSWAGSDTDNSNGKWQIYSTNSKVYLNSYSGRDFINLNCEYFAGKYMVIRVYVPTVGRYEGKLVRYMSYQNNAEIYMAPNKIKTAEDIKAQGTLLGNMSWARSDTFEEIALDSGTFDVNVPGYYNVLVNTTHTNGRFVGLESLTLTKIADVEESTLPQYGYTFNSAPALGDFAGNINDSVNGQWKIAEMSMGMSATLNNESLQFDGVSGRKHVTMQIYLPEDGEYAVTFERSENSSATTEVYAASDKISDINVITGVQSLGTLSAASGSVTLTGKLNAYYPGYYNIAFKVSSGSDAFSITGLTLAKIGEAEYIPEPEPEPEPDFIVIKELKYNFTGAAKGTVYGDCNDMANGEWKLLKTEPNTSMIKSALVGGYLNVSSRFANADLTTANALLLQVYIPSEGEYNVVVGRVGESQAGIDVYCAPGDVTDIQKIVSDYPRIGVAAEVDERNTIVETEMDTTIKVDAPGYYNFVYAVAEKGPYITPAHLRLVQRESKPEYEMGDINGDGKVNTRDITALRRYIAGGYEVTVIEKLADTDEDGKVNTRDVIELRNFIAN